MNNKGFALIMAILVIVLFAVLGVIAASLFSSDIEIAADTLRSTQAFYIAEAGLQDVYYRLKNDEDYRDAPTTASEGLWTGNYSVDVTKDDTTYTLVSTGTVGDVIRKIQRSVVVSSGTLTNAVHADGATVNFAGSSGTINGDVSYFTTVLPDPPPVTITGDLKKATEKVNPGVDLPTYLALAQADDTPPGSHVANNLTFDNAVYDGVYYAYKGVTINTGAVIKGSVICEKNITFANGPTVVQITPELSTRALADGQNYVALYAIGSITSSDAGAPSGRRGLQNSTINGLVMSVSNMKFEYLDNTTFNGTLIFDNNVDLSDALSFTVNYDADIFSPMIVGFTFEAGEPGILLQSDWEEIE